MSRDAPSRGGETTLSLAEWHRRLEAHFQALATRRAVSDWPVFALEHGLNGDEVLDLERAIHQALPTESPSLKSSLPWVVYAAEFGYRYRGDEYWQSFAAETPGWNDRWRGFIREIFQRFARTYHGARPEGAWAGNFTIICWPITHGVLPRDLQRQLAKLLYDARFSLRPELFATATALGTHLRGSSYNASARFREFAENSVLLGQIAAALLVQEPEHELLSLPTLRRIVADINRERAAAEWLKEARTSANYLRVRGLSSRLDPAPDPARPASGTASGLARAWDDAGNVIRAQFILRPRAGNCWDVLVELPDLTPIFRLLPQHREALARSRSRVVGSREKNLARGRLVGGGAQRLLMESWPDANTPLVELDGGSPELRMLLGSSLRAPPGETHLFSIASDGLAYFQKERAVRPGRSYVLLRKEYVDRPFGELEKVGLSCAGINALQFTVPDLVSDLWETLLKNLGLRAIHTLDVWPAGLCPADWDGQGEAAWLERDEVLLGVSTDHSVTAVEVSMGGAMFRAFPIAPADKPTVQFISVGRLPTGVYQATVRTSSLRSGEQPIGRLAIRIRGENVTGAGRSVRQPIALSTYPSTPTLEDVWEGRLQLQIRGPVGVALACRVRFRSRHSTADLFSKKIPHVNVPLDPETWDRLFDQHVRRDKSVEGCADLADELSMEFDAGVIGAAVVSAEREFTPLRWVTRRGNGQSFLGLIDDSGASEIRGRFRSLEAPDREVTLLPDALAAGLTMPFPGGLFIATDGVRTASAVFVPPSRGTLAQLKVAPVISSPRRDSASLAELLRCAAEWQNAHVKGSALAGLFKRRATQAILAEVCGVVGGPVWMRAERTWRADESENSIQQMKHALTEHPDERILAVMILSRAADWADCDAASRLDEFASSVRSTARCIKTVETPARSRRFTESFATRAADIIAAKGLCAFALLAASNPAGLLAEYATEELERGIRELLEKPIILRAARLTVLAVHWHLRAREPNAPLYAGWDE